MGLLRSEEMGLYLLLIPREHAYDVVGDMGKLGGMQFIDADEQDTPAFARHFHNNVKRCEDALVKLHEIEMEIHRCDYEILKCRDYGAFLKQFDQMLSQNYSNAQQKYFEQIEDFIDKKQIFMHQLLQNFEDAVAKRNSFLEELAVLKQAISIYNLQNENNQREGRTILSCVAGTIDAQDADRFNRTLFRASKGNCLTQINEISLDVKKNRQILNGKTREPVRKSTFIVMFAGTANGAFKQKIMRVCDAFGANLYDVPEQQDQQMQQIKNLDVRINETNDLVLMTEDELEKFFRQFINTNERNANEVDELATCSYIEQLKMQIIREKLIYSQMNLLQPKGSVYHGYVWLEKSKEPAVTGWINQARQNSNFMGQLHSIDSKEYNITPPTLNRTNDFTHPAQEITNTYGIPRYREANPALFAYMTFPFLFAVMFGDIGHGAILFIFANYLLFVKPNRAKPGPLDDLFKHRYLIWFMGFFAIYTGALYNDFFGMQLNLFGSCYSTKTMMKDKDCTYPFGMDPIWGITSNKLSTYNSLKMKLSVILGVLQMTLGVFLKAGNAIFFGSALDFFFEFIPQLVFLSCTFGYMCFMIFYKWLIDWDGITDKAPSILTNMLKFFLNFGATDPNAAELYDGQAQIQQILLIAALIAVPLMLLPKPFILNMKHGKKEEKKDPENYHQLVEEEDPQKKVEQQESINPIKVQEKPFSFADEFVHQIIETIEFVLGCISHTASYLRLWALSLAHSQLAEVFFHKSMTSGLVEGNPVALVIGYMVFALVTFGVLLCMDQLECFLHTLRLHWVEFQSKFYKADGYKFQPFCYITALETGLAGSA